MSKSKWNNFLWGTVLVGGLISAKACGTDNSQNQDDDEQPKIEIQTQPEARDSVQITESEDKYGNVALFERTRSKMKFALAFVENYYPYIYWCGKKWTTGHGLTILYDANGSSREVSPDEKPLSIEESDVRVGRYMTFEILKDIKRYVKVPMDENTLIAACVLRYCIGNSNFKKSEFLQVLNAGGPRKELAKTMTGWRQQEGVLNRCYFFAALLMDEIQFSDLLNLTAEGCYNLSEQDIVVYEGGKPKNLPGGFREWDFSKIQDNLKKAKGARTVRLNLGKKRYVNVKCEKTKDIVPEYIWKEVTGQEEPCVPQDTKSDEQSGTPWGMLGLGIGVIGAGIAVGRMARTQKHR